MTTHDSLFAPTEGDRWRWQLETMTELARFIKAHGPGKPGALPAVSWQVGIGFHATARLSPYEGGGRDLRAVLAAYAEALGSEVTSVDLGPARGTQYRVKGTIGRERVSDQGAGRIQLLLIADISPEDEQDQADTDTPRCARCDKPIEPALVGGWWHGGIVTDHEAVPAAGQDGAE